MPAPARQHRANCHCVTAATSPLAPVAIHLLASYLDARGGTAPTMLHARFTNVFGPIEPEVQHGVTASGSRAVRGGGSETVGCSSAHRWARPRADSPRREPERVSAWLWRRGATYGAWTVCGPSPGRHRTPLQPRQVSRRLGDDRNDRHPVGPGLRVGGKFDRQHLRPDLG